MKPAAFDYVRAESVAEALAALAEAGDDGRVLAGGQSLGPMLNLRLARPEVVVDIGQTPGLGRIEWDGGAVMLTAGVTQARLLADPRLAARQPLLAEAMPWIGHVQTRARGTVCGSLAHADPAAELPLLFRTIGGAAVARSAAGQRMISAEDFFEGVFETALAPDELLYAVRFDAPPAGAGVAFREGAERHGDFAIVAAAATRRSSSAGTAWRTRASTMRRRTSPSRSIRAATRRRTRPTGAVWFAWSGRKPCGGRWSGAMRIDRTSRREIAFTLNGRPAVGAAQPRMLLTDFLRHEIGLTGTHVGCEHGVCGACTIQVDGAPVRACLTYAVQVEGRDVRTVEGLAAPGGALSPLQQAFRRHHALQCGFCTAGILMTMDAWLKENPTPTEREVREALSGTICRCTGYTQIVAAVMDVVQSSAAGGEHDA